MNRLPRSPGGTLVILAVAAAALVASCSSGPEQLPGEVSARVYQTRSDVAVDKVEIQIRNGSDRPIVVTEAVLRSPSLAAPAGYSGPATIPPGAIVDLKTPLPEAACSGATGGATVQLEFAIGGRAGSAELPAPDSLQQLPAIAADRCRQRGVAEIVTITSPDGARTTRAGTVALTFGVTPTGKPGSVRFGHTEATTLLTPASPEGDVRQRQRIDLSVTGDSPPTRLVLRYLPGRCDAHALAEDKQGTLLPATVSLDSAAAGRIVLPVPAVVRSQIYRYVADYCRR